MSEAALASLVHFMRPAERILAIVGAGLSQPSGIPTFQGNGKYFRGRESHELACKATFEEDPILVWTYYESMRQKTLSAMPNAGHRALTALARVKPKMLIVNQNIDGS